MVDGRILVLGMPVIQANGQVVIIQRRINRGILFFLASQGKPIYRDSLLTLFWPERNETHARSRLREALSRLKQTLPGFLAIDPIQISIDLESVEVDLHQFEELIQKIGEQPWNIPAQTPLPSTLVQYLSEAVNLWQGSKFLGGYNLPYSVELENWINITSSRLEQQFLRLLLRLGEHNCAIGNHGECERLVQKAFLIDRYDASIHARLLNCLLQSGRITDAQKYLNQIEQYNKKEEIYQLSDSLQIMKLRLLSSQPESIQPPQNILWDYRNTLVIPFVGRSRILEQMQKSYQAGGGVVILGESGQGKTRLVQEFCNAVHPFARVFLVTCRSGEDNLPYQPIIDLFRQNVTSADWREIPTVWTGQLSLLLLELHEIIDMSGILKLKLDTRYSPFTRSSKIDGSNPPGIHLFEQKRENHFLHR